MNLLTKRLSTFSKNRLDKKMSNALSGILDDSEHLSELNDDMIEDNLSLIKEILDDSETFE